MALPLYRRHSPGLAATYADLENHALSQGEALFGTPGSVTLRSNGAGVQFWVRQYYDFERRKRDEYIVAYDAANAAGRVAAMRTRIEEAKQAIGTVRLLAREGYATMTPRHLATLAPLGNHGLFAAGAILIGAHAFEVIVNRLGVRAESFATEDVDIARNARLAMAPLPQGGFLELLRQSGIDFVSVPPFDPREPSIKFKERGRSRFTVDLLVPASGDKPGLEQVPELGAHAVALPYLRYLLAETQMGAALSTQGVVAVRVPTPERFALHKMMVSRLRRSGSEKSDKDLRQAALLVAALGELQPGALQEAYRRIPISTRSLVRKSVELMRSRLEPHPQALEEIVSLVKA